MPVLMKICFVALGILLIAGVMAIMIGDYKDADNIFDNVVHEFEKAYWEDLRKMSEQKTGMKKLEELKTRLGNLAMADGRPALWRLCRSLVESLDEIQKEHDAELEEVRVIARGFQARGDECENERRAAEEMVTELEGQLRAMSDLANSAMADAKKWQNAYMKQRVETPIVQRTDAIWHIDGEMPDGAVIMSQQAKTAREAQEERIPRNGFHEYRVKYYSYDDHRWHDMGLWSDGVMGVEDWVKEHCGGGVPMYDCKVIA